MPTFDKVVSKSWAMRKPPKEKKELKPGVKGGVLGKGTALIMLLLTKPAPGVQ